MKENKIFNYIIVALSFLMAATYGLVMNVGGVFAAPMMKNLNILQGSYTLSMTFLTSFLSVGGLFIEKLFKKYYFKKVILLAVLGLTISTLLLAFITNIWQLYILSILRGLFMGMIGTVPVLFILNNWFISKRGKVTSIVNISSGICGSILTPLFGSIIANFNWRVAYIVMSILILIFSLPVLLTKFELKPEDQGLSAFRDKENDNYSSKNFGVSLSQNYIWLFTLLIILLLSLQNLQAFFTGYTFELNFQIEVGAFMLSSAMLGNMIGKLVLGSLSDRIGIEKSIRYLLIGIIFGLILLLIGNNKFFLYLGSFLYGSTFAISVIGFSLLTFYFFGSKNYVKIYPRVSFFSSVVNIIINPLMGYSIDFIGSYKPVIGLMIIFVVIGFFILLLLIRKRESLRLDVANNNRIEIY